MKRFLNKALAVLIAVVVSLSLLPGNLALAATDQTIDESMRLAVISDLHYYPVSYTGNENSAYQNFAKGNLRLIGENSAAAESAVNMIIADNPEVVLVTGDLTNDGEKQSALELAAVLQRLEDTGIKVYVINGNHDIYSETAVSFESGAAVSVDNISPVEFRQIFKNFGYDGKDEAVYYQGLNTTNDQFIQGGMSYVVTPKPGYKILMLDSEVYTADYLGQSQGMLSPEVLAWAVEQLTSAQENGEVVVGGMHHPLVTHFGNDFSGISLGSTLTLFETIDNNRIAAEQLANANLKYVFTGHMHGNDIAQYTSRKGNTILDIETAALGVIGSPVRFAEVTRDDIQIESRSISTIVWNGVATDYQEYLNEKLYNSDLAIDALDGSILTDVETVLSEKTIYDLALELLGIDIKEMVEAKIIETLSETMEVDASVGKFKVNINLDNPNDPIIHMWPTGAVALLPDYDVSIRNNIFVGLDDLLITQFNTVWLTPDSSGQTRLKRALHQVVKDVESMVVHENGKTLHDVLVESLQASTLGNESAPEWVQETIADFKINLARKLAKDYLIPSLKTNIINPFLDEMYLDINKTFPSKSIYRDALGYILGGSYGKQMIPLRDILTNLGDLDVDAEIDDLIRKYVDNDSDISMVGNPISSLISSQWTDSIGQDDAINQGTIRYEIPDADPNAVADVEYKNIHLGVGTDQSESFVTWYSTSAIDGKVQIARKSDSADGVSMPADSSKITEVAASVSTTIETEFTSNKAVITGLEENTDYIYRVGNESDWSETIQFRTNTFGSSWGFVFSTDAQIGSTGSLSDDQSGWYSSLELIMDKYPDASFILHTGDQVENPDSTEQYDSFLGHEILQKFRLSTLVGNHDDGDVAYSEHFQNPNVQQDSGTSTTGSEAGNYWYIYNNALFISLNANNSNYDEHIEFLRNTVSQQSEGTDWQIVTYHQSTYSAANHSEAAGLLTLRSKISPVISELGVDVVLMGHDHSYVRTYMMDGTTPQTTAEVEYSVTDPAENQVLYVTGNSPASKHYTMKDKDFNYAAVKNQEGLNNISYVEITAGSIRVVTYRTESADLVPYENSDQMTIVDEFTIYNTSAETKISSPTLNVPADITLSPSEYADFTLLDGVSAKAYDGTSLTEQISISGTIDGHTDGTYKLIYSVENNGLTTQAVRFVTIDGNTVDVTFDAQGGLSVDRLTGVTPGSTITEPALSSKEYYDFAGWYTDAELSNPWNFLTDTVTEDITLYAKWVRKQYEVTFVTNDQAVIDSVSAEALSTLDNLPDLTQDGFEFAGWYKDEQFQFRWESNDQVTENITLYAKWIEIHESIVVLDAANGSSLQLINLNSGELIEQPENPLRTGYVFVGWNTQRDGSGHFWNFENDQVASDELYLYAQWDFAQVELTLNRRNGEENTVQSVQYGKVLKSIGTPIRESYTFTGWTYDAEGLQAYASTDVFTEDTTLYGQWIYSGLLEIIPVSDQFVSAQTEFAFAIGINYEDSAAEEVTLSLGNDFGGLLILENNVLKSAGLPSGKYPVNLNLSVSGRTVSSSFTINAASDIQTLDALYQEYLDLELETQYITAEDNELISEVASRVAGLLADPHQNQELIDQAVSDLQEVNQLVNDLMTARKETGNLIASYDSHLERLTFQHFYGDAYAVYFNDVSAYQLRLSGPMNLVSLTGLKADLEQSYVRLLSQKRTADASGLTVMINSSRANVEQSLYTADTWATFNQALEAGEYILENLDVALQSEVDNAAAAIASAMGNLLLKEDLQAFIDQASRILAYNATYFIKDDYTSQSYEIFAQYTSELEAIIERYEQGQTVTAQELGTAITNLESSKQGLILQTVEPNQKLINSLADLVRTTEQTNGQFTASTKNALNYSLQNARMLIAQYEENPAQVSQDSVNEQISCVITAYANLRLQSLEDLENILNLQKGIDFTQYTEASVASYQNALLHARGLVNTASRDQGLLNEAIQSLNLTFRTLAETGHQNDENPGQKDDGKPSSPDNSARPASDTNQADSQTQNGTITQETEGTASLGTDNNDQDLDEAVNNDQTDSAPITPVPSVNTPKLDTNSANTMRNALLACGGAVLVLIIFNFKKLRKLLKR